ncbi:hypothetical protein N499_0689A, partial [Wolbachia pipientis wVitA]
MFTNLVPNLDPSR